MAEIVQPVSLQERIASEQARLATDADLPETVMLSDDGTAQRIDEGDDAEPSGSQGMTPGRPLDTQSYPTSPAGPPQYDPAVVQQIMQRAQAIEAQNQQLLMQQRIAALQADELKFAESIADRPPWEQERLLHERERQQSQTINMFLQQKNMELTDQLNGIGQSENDKAETVAKRILAYTKASRAGLDFANPVVFSSLTGAHITHPDQMDSTIAGLVQLTGGAQRPIVAGGARSTNSGPPKPRVGSGNLSALINSRSYELSAPE